MKLLLNFEEALFAAGKAPVVLGVTAIIIVGIGVWLFYMDRKIKNLEEKIDNLD